ncbi:MAG: hypothetical protein JWN11_1942 [Hyphomicrobiales bacterium]|nr:hypothetical protein [Hyphomicrobiales bacterium]
MNENEFRDHLEEYTSLRTEIAATTKLLYDTFTWAALASGGITAWLLSNDTQVQKLGTVPSTVAGFIPFVLSLLACLGFYHFSAAILSVARYMRKLEDFVAAPGLGWERAQRAVESESIARLTRIRFGAGWAILISANLLAAILV